MKCRLLCKTNTQRWPPDLLSAYHNARCDSVYSEFKQHTYWHRFSRSLIGCSTATLRRCDNSLKEARPRITRYDEKKSISGISSKIARMFRIFKFRSQINAQIQFSDFTFFENLDMLVRFQKILYCFEISEIKLLKEKYFSGTKFCLVKIWFCIDWRQLFFWKKNGFFLKVTYHGNGPLKDSCVRLLTTLTKK